MTRLAPRLAHRLLLLLLPLGLLWSCNRSTDNTAASTAADSTRLDSARIRESFGQMPSGDTVYRHWLRRDGMAVSVLSYGGIVQSLQVPGPDGKPVDVVLGFDSLAGYLADPPYFGALIGRYGNRIAKGRFTLNGKTYNLATNNGPNHLHGGKRGFDKVLWTVRDTSVANNPALHLHYTSPNGEEGYPGTLQVDVIYSLTAEGLRIDYSATTDAPTPVNLTQHSYFNLLGQDSLAAGATILGHTLQVHANYYTPVDATLIPTGKLASVQGTPFDFREGKRIGQDIGKVPGGYDHNFVLGTTSASGSGDGGEGQLSSPPGRGAGGEGLRQVASLSAPTGLSMQVWTTEPGLQFYSGNFLDGSIRGKAGARYVKHAGLCLEAQHFPDSPNRPDWPSTILQPGQTYRQTTEYRFRSTALSKPPSAQ